MSAASSRRRVGVSSASPCASVAHLVRQQSHATFRLARREHGAFVGALVGALVGAFVCSPCLRQVFAEQKRPGAGFCRATALLRGRTAPLLLPREEGRLCPAKIQGGRGLAPFPWPAPLGRRCARRLAPSLHGAWRRRFTAPRAPFKTSKGAAGRPRGARMPAPPTCGTHYWRTRTTSRISARPALRPRVTVLPRGPASSSATSCAFMFRSATLCVVLAWFGLVWFSLV
jgi:hypothetical protein